jgi:hypothetical protein
MNGLWRRGQAGWSQRFPLMQAPNPPLLLAFAGRALSARTAGTSRRLGRAISTAGLAVWAWQEATRGVNWFRRLLGAATLLRLTAGLAREFKRPSSDPPPAAARMPRTYMETR